MCVHVHGSAWKRVGVSFLLPAYGFQGLNTGHHAWYKVLYLLSHLINSQVTFNFLPKATGHSNPELVPSENSPQG